VLSILGRQGTPTRAHKQPPDRSSLTRSTSRRPPAERHGAAVRRTPCVAEEFLLRPAGKWCRSRPWSDIPCRGARNRSQGHRVLTSPVNLRARPRRVSRTPTRTRRRETSRRRPYGCRGRRAGVLGVEDAVLLHHVVPLAAELVLVFVSPRKVRSLRFLHRNSQVDPCVGQKKTPNDDIAKQRKPSHIPRATLRPAIIQA